MILKYGPIKKLPELFQKFGEIGEHGVCVLISDLRPENNLRVDGEGVFFKRVSSS